MRACRNPPFRTRVWHPGQVREMVPAMPYLPANWVHELCRFHASGVFEWKAKSTTSAHAGMIKPSSTCSQTSVQALSPPPGHATGWVDLLPLWERASRLLTTGRSFTYQGQPGETPRARSCSAYLIHAATDWMGFPAFSGQVQLFRQSLAFSRPQKKGLPPRVRSTQTLIKSTKPGLPGLPRGVRPSLAHHLLAPARSAYHGLYTIEPSPC